MPTTVPPIKSNLCIKEYLKSEIQEIIDNRERFSMKAFASRLYSLLYILPLLLSSYFLDGGKQIGIISSELKFPLGRIDIPNT